MSTLAMWEKCKPALGVLDLRLQQLLVPLQVHCQLLLLPELVSQPSSINHGTLGLLLGHANQVGASLVTQALVGVGKLLLNHAA